MVPTVIEYTETFSNSTDLAIAHFSRRDSEEYVITKIENTIGIFENCVSSNPYIYPVSPSIFEISGITSVREANINGYRFLYEVSDHAKETVITAFLLLGQRLSVKEQLINHCLMYK